MMLDGIRGTADRIIPRSQHHLAYELVVPSDRTWPKTKGTVLTRLEREVLVLAALHPGGRFLSNNEIGQRLGMSVNSVKLTIHRACAKLEARNRYEAIFFASNRGEIDLRQYCSLDELAATFSSLGPDTLSRIAHLVRHKLVHGPFPGKDERVLCTYRRQGAILTRREQDVLILAGRGLPNIEIADRLCISVAAARTFIDRACAKLGACNRANAVLLALSRREIGVGEMFSFNELVQFLAPFGVEFVEKTAQLLSQRDMERAQPP